MNITVLAVIKWLSSLIVVASLSLSVTAGAEVSAINTKGLFNDYAIKGYDAVSYWDQSPAKGDKAFSVEWRGATWLFSSQAHLDKFMLNPVQYAPQYGGYCAWAMADGKGRAVNIDPQAWSIYQDKLYLNYNQNVLKEWLKTKDSDIEVADKNYPNISDVKTYIK